MPTIIVFIISIFIIIVLCMSTTLGADSYKFGNEKAEKIKKDLMCNKDFQDELVKKIANPQYKEQILDLIKDDLMYIYGDAWKNLFLNKIWITSTPCTTVFDSAENIILFLLLSKSGLVPDCYRFSGIQISNSNIANIYEALKILHCVERNIQQKRRTEDYKLIFIPTTTYEKYGKHMGPATPRYDQPYMGSFHWAFESFYYNSKFVMKDIHNPTLVDSCKKCSIGERSEKELNNPYKDKLTL